MTLRFAMLFILIHRSADSKAIRQHLSTDTDKRPYLLLGGPEMGLKTGCGNGYDRWKHKPLLQDKERIMQKRAIFTANKFISA